MKNFSKFIIVFCLVFSAAAIGSVFTSSSVNTWYAGLIKPALNPPNWIFGPVWTIIYVLMGLAAFLVWREGSKSHGVAVALAVFMAQLVLNAFWSIVFFAWQNPLGAFAVIIALWLMIFTTLLCFYKISRLAAYLVLPYLLWVSFAAYLNCFLWILN